MEGIVSDGLKSFIMQFAQANPMEVLVETFTNSTLTACGLLPENTAPWIGVQRRPALKRAGEKPVVATSNKYSALAVEGSEASALQTPIKAFNPSALTTNPAAIHDQRGQQQQQQQQQPQKQQQRPQKPKQQQPQRQSKPQQKTAAGEPQMKFNCPPIMSSNLNTAALVSDLGTIAHKFIITKNTTYSQVVRCSDMNTHSEVLKYCEALKIQCHSFPEKGTQKPAFIIRGLQGNANAADIAQEIKEQTGVVVNCRLVENGFSKENKITLNVFSVVLPNQEAAKLVTAIRYLMRVRISWEKKRRTGEMQCFRCQSYGHHSRFCYRQARCMKCDQDHEPGKCKVFRERTLQEGEMRPEGEPRSEVPYCWVCQSHGHVSNYRGCPVVVRRAAAKQERKERAQEERFNAGFAARRQPARNLAPVQDDLSWPELRKNMAKRTAAAPAPQQPTTPKRRQQQQSSTAGQEAPKTGEVLGCFDEITRENFNCSFLEMLQRGSVFAKKYHSLTDAVHKKAAIASFIIELCL